MKRKGIFKALPILIILSMVGIGMCYFYWMSVHGNDVFISHASGIYTESIRLRINTIRPAVIYYTLDGSIPEADNENAYVYDKPIEIELQEDTAVYSIQIRGEYDNGTHTPIFMREFVMEKEGAERYQSDYVISVTGSEEELWGYEEGIFVRGRQFDAYMAANPDVNFNTTIIPANYNSDREVEVHVSMFSAKGQEIISKNCGLRIYGNFTRGKNQKSFRLYARTSYDGKNEFEYCFLPKLISDDTNTIIDEFQRISLHNSGNDNGYGFVRNALIGELARQFGFQDVLVSESAVVYVNGRYQGLYWLQNTYDDKYFKEKYGDYEGEMLVCEGTLSHMNSGREDTDEYINCIEEYNLFCQWIKEADLSLERNWEVVEKTIDVVNFAKYMAIEYYIGNIDWPDNNVKVYQYVSNEEHENDTVFDGRFRYLLFDTDYGFGLLFQDAYGYDETTYRLEDLCYGRGEQELFGSMMQRTEFKELFINAVLLLSQGAFSADNVEKVLNEFCKETNEELQYMFEETELLNNSLWESDDNSYANVKLEHDEIMTYAENRPDIVRGEMQAVLGCGKALGLQLLVLEQSLWLVNGIDAGNEYNGYCFENIPMAISCKVPVGSQVNGYFVNDIYVEGEVLKLHAAELGINSENLVVRPDIMTWPVEQLDIQAYHIDDGNDYVILQNTGNVELLLSDYSISDSVETSKGRLPAAVLLPGDVYYVYGKQYTGGMKKNGVRMSFSWNDEEAVILSSNKAGIIVQKRIKGEGGEEIAGK